MSFQSVILFNPKDWYWVATDGRIYSSARNKLVHSYDTPYALFVQQHGAATPWPKDTAGNQTNAALSDVLAAYGITLANPLTT